MASQSNFTISEFKKALHDYTTAVNLAKSKQSLKNYHSKYRKFINTKLEKSQEKRYMQISNAIPTSILTTHDFDIFPLIYFLRSTTVSLKLPTTYYYNENLEFLIRTKENLEITSGLGAISEFFNDLEDKGEYPVCVFKTFDGKIRFFDSRESAKEFMDENEDKFGVYQVFIKPSKGIPTVLMHHSIKNSVSKSYILQKNSHGENDKNLYRRRFSLKFKGKDLNRSETQAIFYNNCDRNDMDSDYLDLRAVENTFLEAQNLSCIDKSDLIKKQSIHENSTAAESVSEVDYNNKYEIDPMNAKSLTIYTVKIPIPEIESMTNILIGYLSRDFKHKLHKEVEEFQALYIKDKAKGWLLLKIKALKCSESNIIIEHQPQTEKSISPLLQSPTTMIINHKKHKITASQSISIMHNKSEFDSCNNSLVYIGNKNQGQIILPPVREESRIKSKIIAKNIRTPMNKTIDKEKILKRNTIAIKPVGKVRARNSYQILQNKTTFVNVKDHARHLEESVKSYEKLNFITKIQSKNYCKPSEKYSPMCFWKEFSYKVNEEILKSSLRRYFKEFTRKNINQFSNAVLRLFCLDIDLQFKKEIEESHYGLNITEEDYFLYRDIFIKNLRDFSIEDEDLKMIMISFDMMKECVVEKSFLDMKNI